MTSFKGLSSSGRAAPSPQAAHSPFYSPSYILLSPGRDILHLPGDRTAPPLEVEVEVQVEVAKQPEPTHNQWAVVLKAVRESDYQTCCLCVWTPTSSTSCPASDHFTHFY